MIPSLPGVDYAPFDDDNVDDEIDVIYRFIDELMRNDDFAKVDEILQSVKVDDLSIVLMLAYLSITFPAKHELQFRDAYYEKVWQRLVILDPARCVALIAGLK